LARKAKEVAAPGEPREFRAYISERYPALSVGGVLRFSGGYYRAKSESEEEMIEALDKFNSGIIRYAKGSERNVQNPGTPMTRRGARSSLSMRGEG
jgi:hypothetical protein